MDPAWVPITAERVVAMGKGFTRSTNVTMQQDPPLGEHCHKGADPAVCELCGHSEANPIHD